MVYTQKTKAAAVLIVLLIILFVIGYNNYVPIQNTDLPDQDQENPEVDQFNEAIQSGDLSECNDLAEPRKTNCMIEVLSRDALEKDDISICSTVAGIEDMCLSKYFTKRAADTGDETLCEGIAEQDQCYFRLAVSKSDSSLCDNIESETIKNNCMNAV